MSELTDRLLNLDLSENIFSDIKYIVAGELDENIKDVLNSGGAEYHKYISDDVTLCIIGNNPDANDISVAIDTYEIPAVVPKWVLMCATLQRRLDTKPYLYCSKPKLFAGKIFCFSRIIEDRIALWGLITYNGGLVHNKLSLYCDYLVTGSTNSLKYIKAESLGGDKIKIITPDWVLEAVRSCSLPDPIAYHPRLVKWPKPHESTISITGFEPEVPETDNQKESISESTEDLLERLKQRMPRPPSSSSTLNDQLTSNDELVAPPNVVAPSYLNKMQNNLGMQITRPPSTQSTTIIVQSNEVTNFGTAGNQYMSQITQSPVHQTIINQQNQQQSLGQQQPQQQQSPVNVNRFGPPQTINRQSLNSSQIHQQLLQQRIHHQQQQQQNLIHRTSTGQINVQQQQQVAQKQVIQNQLLNQQGINQQQSMLNQQQNLNQLTQMPQQQLIDTQNQQSQLIGQQQKQQFMQQNALVNQQNQAIVQQQQQILNQNQQTNQMMSPQQNQYMNQSPTHSQRGPITSQQQNQLLSQSPGPVQQNVIINQHTQQQVISQSPTHNTLVTQQHQQILNQPTNQNQLLSPQQQVQMQNHLIGQQKPIVSHHQQGQLISQQVPNQSINQQQFVAQQQQQQQSQFVSQQQNVLMSSPNQMNQPPQQQQINHSHIVNQQMMMSQDNQQQQQQQQQHPTQQQNILNMNNIQQNQQQHMNQLNPQQIQQQLKQEQHIISQNQGLPPNLMVNEQRIVNPNQGQAVMNHNPQLVNQQQLINQQQMIHNRTMQQQQQQQDNMSPNFTQQLINQKQSLLVQQQQQQQNNVPNQQQQQIIQQNLGVQQQFSNQSQLPQSSQQGGQQINQTALNQMNVQALNQQLNSQNLGQQLNQQLLQKQNQNGSGLEQKINQPNLMNPQQQQPQQNVNQQVIRTQQPQQQFPQQMLINQQGQQPQQQQQPSIIQRPPQITQQQIWAQQQQQQQQSNPIQGQQIIRHPVNVTVQQAPGNGPRIQWIQGQTNQRQLIHLDAQTHNQLQSMPPDQQALFVAKLQKQRQLQFAKPMPQRASGHILIRGSVPPGLTPQQQVVWVQQQAKQQGIILSPNLQQNIAQGNLIQQPAGGAAHGIPPHTPGLSPINQNSGQQFVGDQVQLRQYRLQQLQLQREQAQKTHLVQQAAQPGVRSGQGQPIPADSTSNLQVPVNPKTKTALANMLSSKYQSAGAPGASPRPDSIPEPSAAGTLRMMTAQHNAAINSKPQEIIAMQRRAITGPNGEPIKASNLPLAVQNEPPKLQYNHKPPSMPIQHRAGPFYGHNPNLKLPPELFLLGCVFTVVEVEDYLNENLPEWKEKIERYGGEVEKQYTPRVTHLICETQKHGMVTQALRDAKRVVTVRWLNDVIKLRQVLPPWTALHLPQLYFEISPAIKHLISCSGFEGNIRHIVKEMIMYTGAKFTSYFSKHNTLLICAKTEGSKYNHAKKWNIPVVNVQWLTDMILGNFNALNQMDNPAYQTFPNPPNLNFDPKLVLTLMNPWKSPINISQELYERVKRSASPSILPKFKKLKVEQTTTEENESSSDAVKHENADIVENPNYKILFSQFETDKLKQLEKQARELGAIIVRHYDDFTHLVLPKLVRSHKLLFAIVKCCHIVSEKWLEESHSLKAFQPEENFPLPTEDFNESFKMSFEKTLLTTNRDKLFDGKTFWVTPSVFPTKRIIIDLIEASGGQLERIRRNRQRIESTEATAPFTYFILTAQEDLHLVADLLKIKKDKETVIYNVELILSAVMKQKFETEPYAVNVV